jgi:hypothetical protein
VLTFWYEISFSRSLPQWRYASSTYNDIESVRRYYRPQHPTDPDIYSRLYQVEVDPLAHEFWATVLECDSSGEPLPGRSQPLPTASVSVPQTAEKVAGATTQPIKEIG